MATLNMKGPYSLDHQTIDRIITKKSAGNYALGKMNKNNKFSVSYVGRSDTDLKQRLKQWVNNSDLPLFKYSYATSPKAAFEKECKNYHDFNPPKNEIHPDRPNEANWKCPVCDIFD